jgi:hypothetical protein
MTRFGFFIAGLIVGAWCAGLAMRWEQLRPAPPATDTYAAALRGWRDLEGVDSV